MSNNKWSNIKLVALDMDGTTCLMHGDVIKANVEPIKELHRQGLKVVFVTGRPVYSVLQETKKHKLEQNSEYLVAYNGACIFDVQKNKVLSTNHIPGKIINEIFKVAAKANINVWCYSDDIYHIFTNFDYKGFDEANFLNDSVKITVKPKNADFNINAFKLLIDSSGDHDHSGIQEICEKYKLNIALGITPIYEINSADMNKGIGIQKLSKLVNIDLKDIMAIGDGPNDIPMLKIVGLSIAVGNASAQVKAVAKEETAANVDAGVAKAIYKYILDDRK